MMRMQSTQALSVHFRVLPERTAVRREATTTKSPAHPSDDERDSQWVAPQISCFELTGDERRKIDQAADPEKALRDIYWLRKRFG